MSSIRKRMSSRLTKDRVKLEIRRARGPFIVLVGMVVVALGALSYLVGNLRSSLPWEDPYQVKVAVDDAKGVIAGKQEVRISGFPVGRITEVNLVDGRPVLSIDIDREYAPLYEDARMRLRPKTPLQDLFLDVERRGTEAAGKIEQGATITAQRTRTPIDISRVVNVFDADTRPRVKQAINELGIALGDNGEGLKTTLVQLRPFLSAAQRLTSALALRGAQTKRLVHNFRVMTEELANRDDQLATLVSSGASSLTAVGNEDAALSETLTQFPPTLRQLEGTFTTVRAAADDLDPALDALRPATDALPTGLAALEQLTEDALPAVRALNGPVQRLTPLVTRLQPISGDLDRAFGDLLPQAPRLDDITAQIEPCELAVQKFFNHTLSVTKFGTNRYGYPRGQLVAGLGVLGGQINDPAQRAFPSCAPGGPPR